jgi:hypothetical protein
LAKDQQSIKLVDEENSKTYECDIETVNGGNNEKFIGKGWFKCVEDMGLKDGAELLFTIDNPPKDMYVYRIVWD